MAEDVKSLGIRLDQIVASTGVAIGSTVLNNGDQAVFTITTQSGSGAKVLTTPDVSLYVGTPDFSTQLPGGSSIDESQWQVIGPFNDLASTDNINTKTLVYVRNISAGSQTVTVQTISRVIINSATPLQTIS